MRKRRLRGVTAAACVLGCAALSLPSCSRGATDGANAEPAARLDRDDALGCQGCHPNHYDDWSLSMHAFAAADPVFIAMNARGQRETGGALGAFCVSCHAPLAVLRGATTDGTNLADVPPALRGVTCVVCHTTAFSGNTPAGLLDDSVMRGPIANPVATPAHASVYSPAHDRQEALSADLCGTCHAVTNGHGLEVERTIDEWRTTSYAAAATLRTCGRCHMPETAGVAANIASAPLRAVHGHAMPGVDLGAGSAQTSTLVREFLGGAIASTLCVVPSTNGAQVSVTLDNALVGHAWPSGATHNRRAWVEIVAYSAGASVYSSGVVAPGEAVTASANPPLLILREELFDDAGAPTLFMWNAQTAQSSLLAPATADPANATRTATVNVPAGVDRVTARVEVRAVDHDVADDLVRSGDLAPDVAANLPTLTVDATVLEWTADRGAACLP